MVHNYRIRWHIQNDATVDLLHAELHFRTAAFFTAMSTSDSFLHNAGLDYFVVLNFVHQNHHSYPSNLCRYRWSYSFFCCDRTGQASVITMQPLPTRKYFKRVIVVLPVSGTTLFSRSVTYCCRRGGFRCKSLLLTRELAGSAYTVCALIVIVADYQPINWRQRSDRTMNATIYRTNMTSWMLPVWLNREDV